MSSATPNQQSPGPIQAEPFAVDRTARPGSLCIALTGGTGYVGGRLGSHLLAAGFTVRCLTRSVRKLESRSWAGSPAVQAVEVDLADEPELVRAMRGCDVAYYLVHSMEAAGQQYATHDRKLAQTFAKACALAGVRRIIYLGGLGEMGDELSEHLASRREVEQCLAAGSVPVTVLRAAMIIGSGSASYEILRYLTERLPVMITPRWVKTECQPIAIRDVLRYLLEVLNTSATTGETIDIGGPEIVTYRELIQMMAQTLGLRHRLIVPIPLLTPRLSSLWIHLVTPLSYRVARPLADGLRNRVVCRDDRAQQLMPGELLTPREAIDRAAGKIRHGEVETAWSDAGVIAGDPDWAGGRMFVDSKSLFIQASADDIFAAICKVGGGHGYYAADWLWRIRGWMDRLVGGPGLRRNRRHPTHLAYGDALDFWRVVEVQPPYQLSLRAEMKLPGDAMLEFSVQPAPAEDVPSAGSMASSTLGPRFTLIQTARFRPRGLIGLLYWYAVLPLHGYVFRGMLQGIRREAQATSRSRKSFNGP